MACSGQVVAVAAVPAILVAEAVVLLAGQVVVVVAAAAVDTPSYDHKLGADAVVATRPVVAETMRKEKAMLVEQAQRFLDRQAAGPSPELACLFRHRKLKRSEAERREDQQRQIVAVELAAQHTDATTWAQLPVEAELDPILRKVFFSLLRQESMDIHEGVRLPS